MLAQLHLLAVNAGMLDLLCVSLHLTSSSRFSQAITEPKLNTRTTRDDESMVQADVKRASEQTRVNVWFILIQVANVTMDDVHE